VNATVEWECKCGFPMDDDWLDSTRYLFGELGFAVKGKCPSCSMLWDLHLTLAPEPDGDPDETKP
jgi:hypothetical protein